MQTIFLHSLQGIEIEQLGTLQFGQRKADVVALLGEPSGGDTAQLYYDELGLRVDLDAAGAVEFIEFVGEPDPARYRLSLYGTDPLKTPAAELLVLLSEKDPQGIDDAEAPCCYCFANLSVGVWRPFAEEDVQASIEEMRENGEDTDAEWIQEDLAKSRFFQTVGIGKAGYYS